LGRRQRVALLAFLFISEIGPTNHRAKGEIKITCSHNVMQAYCHCYQMVSMHNTGETF